jgi:hypothetical protein
VVVVRPALLDRRRVAAFVGVAVCVVVWFVVAPHLPRVGLWPAIVLIAAGVLPGMLMLGWIALPLWRARWIVVYTAGLALLALVFSLLGWGLPANFAKFGAAICAGWAFLTLFERVSWVVIVAAIIPVVDAISVWRGPTHTITQHHFHVYTDVAVAFVVPGGGAAYLGPPDILFWALFLAAAARWNLRVGWTWLATTGMYGLTIVIATAASVDGLPALPFLSLGFLATNADLLWRAIRSGDSPAASASSAGDGPASC